MTFNKIKKEKVKKRGAKLDLLLLILSLISLFAVSCRGIELENKTMEVEGYTEPQAMIIVANERNRYQNVYTDAIWNIEVDGDVTFDKYLISSVKSFMEQIKLINMMAEERGVTVTSKERDKIRQLSERYMEGLTEADRAYIGADTDDVNKVYTDYFLANKMAELLTSSADSEISDSEAKIIHVQQIVTASEKKAMALLKMIKIDGDDFETMARRYSEDETIDRELMRDREDDIYEKTAFSLDEGEISNIVEMDGKYYIIKCTDGYDEQATLERKDKLRKAILNKAFQETYSSFKAENNIRFGERFWNKIDFSEGKDSHVMNFFDLYDEEFPD
ncbi:MAG: peptidylprolyl isomerase [Candidatus Avilachnospira sp.]|jgi:foldase protein PrsA